MDEHYAVLGLRPSASDAEVKAQYRRLSLKLHPDKVLGDKVKEEEFKRVAHAYNTIMNPELRAQFLQSVGHSFVENEQRRAARSVWLVCWEVMCLPPTIRWRAITSFYRGKVNAVRPMTWGEFWRDEWKLLLATPLISWVCLAAFVLAAFL